MKTVNFGTSKTEIIKIAREIGAKYVIEWHDHFINDDNFIGYDID